MSRVKGAYTAAVPKLRAADISAHRRDVRDAILDAAGALVAQHGLAAATMAAIAERAGIGRATLYKYFHEVQEVATAWHERQVTRHYAKLEAASQRPGAAIDRLRALLETYAAIAHQEHGTEMAALMRRSPHVVAAYARLDTLVRTLLGDAVAADDVRDDVPVAELAAYALHALDAASSARSGAAVRRLVQLTLDGLAPAYPIQPRRRNRT